MSTKTFHFSTFQSHKLYILLSVLAISLGGIIYILLRPSEQVFFNWINAIGLDNWFNFTKSYSLYFSLLFPEWFTYSPPNGLWAFAYAFLITTIWSEGRSWLKYFWMASIPVLVLGYEILHYAGVIPGTFCMQDKIMGGEGQSIGLFIGFRNI
jgi:hypothetical protein